MRSATFLITIAGRALLLTPFIGFLHRDLQPHLDQMQHLPVYDYREALRPPTRFLPLEEEEFEEES